MEKTKNPISKEMNISFEKTEDEKSVDKFEINLNSAFTLNEEDIVNTRYFTGPDYKKENTIIVGLLSNNDLYNFEYNGDFLSQIEISGY